MTERLTTLLREESAQLTVPPAPANDVLADGHRLVRRRRAGLAAASLGVAGALVAAVAIGGSPGGADGRGDTLRIDPATAAYLQDGAWARGSTIHVGTSTATIDGKVKALYYTSAGVVVRSGDNPWTDSSGPSDYGVVEPDGQVRGLGLDLGDRVPGTDPGQPYLAYADGSGSSWEVKVVDVRTGEQVGTADFTADFTWGGWEAPPVALDGDAVYVGVDGNELRVNWRTGDVSQPTWLPRSRMPEVAGGHFVDEDQLSRDPSEQRTRLSVLDASSGDPLLSQEIDGYAFLSLSPDGRYAKLTVEDNLRGDLPSGFDVFDVATGKSQHFGAQPWDFGWTPDGHLLRVDDDSQAVCSPTTGECDNVFVDPGKGELKIAGNSYES